jgi:hypothetical protein
MTTNAVTLSMIWQHLFPDHTIAQVDATGWSHIVVRQASR